MRIPCAGIQELRIAATYRQVGNANFRSLIEDLGPMHSAINGFINSTLLVWRISVTKSAHIDNLRILRINHDSADLARILQAYVRPGGAAVAGFVNTVTRRQVGSNIRLARSGVDRLGVSRCHGDCSDRSHRLVVEDGPPDSSGIRGFPDSAIDRAKIKSSRVTRHSRDGNYSTSPEWANEPPFEATHPCRRNGLGNRGGRHEKKEDRAETLVDTRPMFVQVAILTGQPVYWKTQSCWLGINLCTLSNPQIRSAKHHGQPEAINPVLPIAADVFYMGFALPAVRLGTSHRQKCPLGYFREDFCGAQLVTIV